MKTMRMDTQLAQKEFNVLRSSVVEDGKKSEDEDDIRLLRSLVFFMHVLVLKPVLCLSNISLVVYRLLRKSGCMAGSIMQRVYWTSFADSRTVLLWRCQDLLCPFLAFPLFTDVHGV